MKKAPEDPTREQFHDLLRKAATTQVVPALPHARKDKPESSPAPQADGTSDA